jgi:putative hydrolase of the HAD superfamily
MIGNSPKSDINPALEAGLGAVLVPHPHTWVLEHQELRMPDGAKFLEVETFADLLRIF